MLKVRGSRLLCAVVLAAGLVLAGGIAVVPTAGAIAEDEGAQGQGFLNPFPPGDVYPLLTIGDTFAEGLSEALGAALSGEPRIQVGKKYRHLEALMRNDFEQQMKELDENLGKEPVQIAVVMLGSSDRVSWRTPNGKRAAIGSEEWKGEFGRRIDRLMRLLKSRGASTYWVGLPSLRRSDANDDAQMMNDVIRERSVVNGVRYVDSFQALADEQGGYADFGPDITGKVRRLREGDGVNFTGAGNEKLAHFVEKQVKRDLTQAKQDRSIPLAGSEAEQARINAAAKATEAARAAAEAAAAERQQAGSGGGGNGEAGNAAPSVTERAAAGIGGATELRAEPSRINLRTVHDGREDVVAIDIVRPALPASVVAAVTRKESADKLSPMGESVLDQIAGGVTVISSITPASEVGAARRKLSPTQSPYFRVLVKGEHLTPKPGRADDLVWPRPEPPAFVAEVPKALKPAPPPPPPAAKDDEPDEKPKKRSRRNRG